MAIETITQPAAGTVDLWRVQLDEGEDLQADLSLLSDEELVRLAKRSGAARKRFIRAHAALRRVVAAYGSSPPRAEDVVAAYDAPPRSVPGLELSLTHCGDLAVVAVSTTALGVDIEATSVADEAGNDLDGMAELTMSDAELAQFRLISPSHQPREWLRAWTRKEAWLKAHGRGIDRQALADVDVTHDSVDAVALIDIVPGFGFVGAVALAHPEVHVTWKEL